MPDLKTLFQHPSPPVIPRSDYAPQIRPADIGQDILHLMPAAGQNAVPPPQTLYDLGSYKTPFRWLWRRGRNIIVGA